MELALLLVEPLPTRLTSSEAIQLVCDILLAYLCCTFISVTTAAENDALPRAGRLDFELEDLINSGSFLSAEGDLIFP